LLAVAHEPAAERAPVGTARGRRMRGADPALERCADCFRLRARCSPGASSPGAAVRRRRTPHGRPARLRGPCSGSVRADDRVRRLRGGYPLSTEERIMGATATVSVPGSEPLDEADASPVYRAAQPALRRAERALERTLRLEHAANIFPLVHVVFYYLLFFCLAWRGLVEKPWLRLPLWVVLVLLNFSLSIGIMHMHAHRKLFTDERANRVLEFLLSLPCSLSY